MSITIIQHNPEASVLIGGVHDHDGERGRVLLEATPKVAQLTPANARQVARKLLQFAEQASPARRSAATLRDAARALSSAGAAAGGRATAAKRTPEQRSASARAAVTARWARVAKERASEP